MACGEVACEIYSCHQRARPFPRGEGEDRKERGIRTGRDLGINLYPRVGGDPRFGEFDALVDGDAVFRGVLLEKAAAQNSLSKRCKSKKR